MQLEICAQNLQSAIHAQAQGADRIELCTGLDVGGLTPSPGTLLEVRKHLNIPIHVLIRVREGDFIFDRGEIRIMARDIAFCRQKKMDGVVIGALNKKAMPDIAGLKKLVAAAGTLECTFHRAFDYVSNTDDALEMLIDLGFVRILTSGQRDSAWEGRDNIRRLVDKAKGRIGIMAASGVNPSNVAALAQHTGAVNFHLSAKKKFFAQKGKSAIEGLDTGYSVSQPEMIAEMRRELDKLLTK